MAYLPHMKHKDLTTTQERPLLSIGIIFRNNIRSIRRCLEPLAQIKKIMTCEIIMADTGSNDGSREVATYYADILFDFPWINDFSSARNAVMDYASGIWYMSVDTDEYMDTDISELNDFLLNKSDCNDIAAVLIRNYDSYDINGNYVDFMAPRLVKLDTGYRYEGCIHESWASSHSHKIYKLPSTILHHDGYAYENENKREKQVRNQVLLKKELKKDPENLRLLAQCVENSRGTIEHTIFVRKSMEVLNKKRMGWKTLGASTIRNAVRAAKELDLPELWDWITLAEEWFPGSYFTRIDTEYFAFCDEYDKGKYAQGRTRGENILIAMSEYRECKGNLDELMNGAVLMSGTYWEQEIKISLADIYIKGNDLLKANGLIEDIEYVFFNPVQMKKYQWITKKLHSMSI